MKQTYEERVQALAEKMAREKYKHSSLFKYKDDEKYPNTNKNIVREISNMLPAARIAVAEMAAEVRNAFGRVRHWVSVTDEWIEIYLKERGLIPDDGQEVSNNE